MYFLVGVCYGHGPTVNDGGAVIAAVVERCEGEDEAVDVGRCNADRYAGK